MARTNERQSARDAEESPTLPPHSIEAEQACLGAALISKPASETVLAMLKPDDFYLEAHRKVFACIGYLTEKEPPIPVDTLSIQEELKRWEWLEKIGGVAYLSLLADSVPTAAHVEYYARIVIEKSVLRQAQFLAQDANAQVTDGLEPQQILSGVIERAEALLDRQVTPEEDDDGISLYDLRYRDLPPILWIVPDLIPQGLILLHSRPKVGKTRVADSLALSVATGGMFLGHFPVNQCDVLYLSLEEGSVPTKHRLSYTFTDQHDTPKNLRMFWEWPRMEEGGFKKLDRYLSRRPGTKLVIIDTLQQVRTEREKAGNVYAEDTVFIRNFKRLADQHGVCVFILHHSRKGGDSDDLIDAASGTAGVTGQVDLPIRLRTIPGTRNAIIEGRGRQVRDFSYALRSDDLVGWVCEGDSDDVTRSLQEQEIIDVIREEGPLKPFEIARELGGKADAIRQRIRRMSQKGVIEKGRNGAYFIPASPTPPHKREWDDVTGVTGVTDNTLDMDETEFTSVMVCHSDPKTIEHLSNVTGCDLAPSHSFEADFVPKNGLEEASVTPVTGRGPHSVTEAEEEALRSEVLRLAKAAKWPKMTAAGCTANDEADWRHGSEVWNLAFITAAHAALTEQLKGETDAR